MGSHGASRASGGGGNNTITMTSSATATNNAYSEGAIFSKRTSDLLEQLENTRSQNGATRVLNALEREKTNIQLSRRRKPKV